MNTHLPTLGLLHYVNDNQREEIETNISVSITDVFDALTCARENARVLEDEILRLLNGERCELSEKRPNRF